MDLRHEANLARELDSHRIERSCYVDEVNKVHADIAQRCEAILNESDFLKLFRVTPSEVGGYIDKEVFFAQAWQ